MRLSDIKGERSLDVVADIIEPIANIAADKKCIGFFQPIDSLPKGQTAQSFFVGRVKKYMPSLIRTHKKDIIAILAAINDKQPKEYAAELTPVTLLSNAIELMNDPVLTTLFISAEKGTSSGSALENTEGLLE